MPNRIPTPGINTPQVRVSKSAQPAMKPVENSASKSVSKNGMTTTYNAKGQPTFITNNRTGKGVGTYNTPGFQHGGGTQ